MQFTVFHPRRNTHFSCFSFHKTIQLALSPPSEPSNKKQSVFSGFVFNTAVYHLRFTPNIAGASEPCSLQSTVEPPSITRTPKGQSEVSVLERCLYKRGHYDNVTFMTPVTVLSVQYLKSGSLSSLNCI